MPVDVSFYVSLCTYDTAILLNAHLKYHIHLLQEKEAAG